MQLTQAAETAKMWFTEIKPFETIIFEMVDEQNNRIVCEFLDPFEGKFSVDGLKGHTYVNEFLLKNPSVENMQIVPRPRKKK